MSDPRVTMHLTNAQAETILRLADGCLQNYGTDDERAELAPLIAAELDRLDQQKPTDHLDRLGATYRPDVARAAIYWDRYTTYLEQQVARVLLMRGQTVDDAVEPPVWELRLQVVVPKVDQ